MGPVKIIYVSDVLCIWAQRSRPQHQKRAYRHSVFRRRSKNFRAVQGRQRFLAEGGWIPALATWSPLAACMIIKASQRVATCRIEERHSRQDND